MRKLKTYFPQKSFIEHKIDLVIFFQVCDLELDKLKSSKRVDMGALPSVFLYKYTVLIYTVLYIK